MRIVPFEQLEPGKFYIPVFERIEPLDNEFGNILDTHRLDSPYVKYLGEDQFESEDGDLVESFYDPELQLDVATNAPDGFVL